MRAVANAALLIFGVIALTAVLAWETVRTKEEPVQG